MSYDDYSRRRRQTEEYRRRYARENAGPDANYLGGWLVLLGTIAWFGWPYYAFHRSWIAEGIWLPIAIAVFGIVMSASAAATRKRN